MLALLFTNCGKEDDNLEISCTPDPGAITYILNNSFEDSEPGINTIPDEWSNCGDTLQSPPDLFQNNLENNFMVTNIAEEGQQYVGMVVRPDETKECLFQSLSSPLNPGSYQIFISYAKPINYLSIAFVDPDFVEVNFNNAVTLDIVGINTNNEEQVLFTTEPNESTTWTNSSVNVDITAPIKEIKLQPNFIGNESYAGSILVDYFRIDEN